MLCGASGQPSRQRVQPVTQRLIASAHGSDNVHTMPLPNRGLLISVLVLAASGAAFARATIDKVEASGETTLAYRESSIPFSCLDNQAQPVGFDVEICDRIVGEAKKVAGRASAANRAELAVVGEPIQVGPRAIVVRREDPALKTWIDGVTAGAMMGKELAEKSRAVVQALSDKPAP
jgi:hypothetical protein